MTLPPYDSDILAIKVFKNLAIWHNETEGNDCGHLYECINSISFQENVWKRHNHKTNSHYATPKRPKGGKKKSKIVVTGNQTRSEEQEERSNIGLASLAL